MSQLEEEDIVWPGRMRMSRVKKLWQMFCEYKLWFSVLLITDGIFGLFLWMADTDAFFALFGSMFLISAVLFCVTAAIINRKEKEREEKIRAFLEHPDEIHEMEAVRSVSAREGQQIHDTAVILREYKNRLNEQIVQLGEYEEYIEVWAHEVKTPLSLMTLVLDNRKNEIAPEIHKKMEYSRNNIQKYIEQILYYARLKATHKDYVFEKLQLKKCCDEVLSDYRMMLSEEHFEIQINVGTTEVVTDKKGFGFMLGQVIGNAVKYKKKDGTQPVLKLEASLDEAVGSIVFKVIDNGAGTAQCDLPFIFEKGFTGRQDEEGKKSTGMGLYLVSEMARDLNIGLEVKSQSGNGFEICFLFPLVNFCDETAT